MNQPNLYRFGQLLSLFYVMATISCLNVLIVSMFWYVNLDIAFLRNMNGILSWMFRIAELSLAVLIALKAAEFGLKKIGIIGAWIFAGGLLTSDLYSLLNILLGMRIDILPMLYYYNAFSYVTLFLSLIVLAGKSLLAFGSKLSLIIKILIPSLGLFSIILSMSVCYFCGHYWGFSMFMSILTSFIPLSINAAVLVFLLLWTRKQKNIQADTI